MRFVLAVLTLSVVFAAGCGVNSSPSLVGQRCYEDMDCVEGLVCNEARLCAIAPDNTSEPTRPGGSGGAEISDCDDGEVDFVGVPPYAPGCYLDCSESAELCGEDEQCAALSISGDIEGYICVPSSP